MATIGPQRRRRSQRGVTLIELMVSLVLSMMLSIVILLSWRGILQQKTRTADVTLRDSEIRAAMDLIMHDLSSAGFLFAGAHTGCDALFISNAQGYRAHYPVEAAAAVSGSTMGFAPSLTLNYPVVAAGMPSDVLAITSASGASSFGDSSTPVVSVAPNAAYDVMATATLPLVSTASLTAGHVGVLQVPDSGQRVCLRVPLTTLGSGSGSANVSSSGSLLAAGNYAGFGALMTPNGFTGPLSNAEIYQGRLIDLGAPPPATQVHLKTVFYIDGSTNAWPTLMRASYSLLDDSQIGIPQPIAAGVVSLQVLFGVDPGGTGAVTAYETGAQVRTNIHQTVVRSVRVALVARTLYPDASFSNTASSVTIPGGFGAVPIPTSYAQHRYVVYQTEQALRNVLWLQ